MARSRLPPGCAALSRLPGQEEISAPFQQNFCLEKNQPIKVATPNRYYNYIWIQAQGVDCSSPRHLHFRVPKGVPDRLSSGLPPHTWPVSTPGQAFKVCCYYIEKVAIPGGGRISVIHFPFPKTDRWSVLFSSQPCPPPPTPPPHPTTTSISVPSFRSS